MMGRAMKHMAVLNFLYFFFFYNNMAGVEWCEEKEAGLDKSCHVGARDRVRMGLVVRRTKLGLEGTILHLRAECK